jgi:predicted nucleic acid-binding protein
MKVFFDTSVLVSAFVQDERSHDACAGVVAGTDDGVVYAHALAECFAMLTGGRLSVRLPPGDAARIIEANVFGRMEVVQLASAEMMRVLADCRGRGVRGGGVYDFLHIAAARRAGAEVLFTLNARHFAAFAPDLAAVIREP